MSDVVAAETALLVQEAPIPVAPFGYGTDIKCIFDLDFTLTNVTGRLLVLQDLIHRVSTERATLPDDPDYGIDLREFLHRGLTQAEVRAVPGQIAAELEKDDRVLRANIELAQASLQEWSIKCRIEPADESGEFTFTLAVTPLTTLLEAVEGVST